VSLYRRRLRGGGFGNVVILGDQCNRIVLGSRGDLRVDALGPAGPVSWQPRRVIVTIGAQERVVPFPGWTLPGVMGPAGATILLKSQAMLPGRRTLVAGQGPLLLAVAAGIFKAGGMVAGVVDFASRREWLARTPALLSRPDLTARGAAWVSSLLGAGVPILSRQALRDVASAQGDALVASVGPVDATGRPLPGRERRFTVDAVAVGHGLTAATDVTRLLRADHAYDAARGGWVPVVDRDFRTSVPKVFAVGGGAGLAGAAAAAPATSCLRPCRLTPGPGAWCPTASTPCSRDGLEGQANAEASNVCSGAGSGGARTANMGRHWPAPAAMLNV
jgi:hypothetical protein